MKVPKLRFRGFSNEWSTYKLGDIALFTNGKAHEQDISRNGKYIVVNSKFISSDGMVKKFSNRQISPLKKHSVVIVMSDIPNGRALAKCFYIDGDDRYTLNQRIGSIVAKGGNVSKFLYYILNRNKYYLAFDSGVGQTNLRRDEVENCPLIIPSGHEQEKIAEFLTVVDERVEAIDKKLDLLEKYKKGAMQAIFSQKIRFKDEEGKNYPDWEEKKLGDATEINPKVGNLPDSFVYIDLESVSQGNLLQENEIKKVTAPSRAQRVLKKEDILFQTVRPYQRNNYFFDLEGDYVASTGYAQIRSEVPKFIYQLLHTDDFVNSVLDYCTGTNYPAINSSDLGKVVIQIPTSSKEQQKIADFLTVIDDKINLTMKELEQAKRFKQSLLQQMFV